MADPTVRALDLLPAWAAALGRIPLAGVRLRIRCEEQSLDATMVAFAGDLPEEERVLVARDARGAYLLCYGREDFAQGLAASARDLPPEV